MKRLPLRCVNSTVPSAVANSVSSPPRPVPAPGEKRVPRWRTMIAPAVTVSPANTFTPSRFAFESRPFLEEPSPFLCATVLLLLRRGRRLLRRRRLGLLARRPRLLGRTDRGDRDPRQLRAVPACLLESALRLEREHLQLLSAQMLDNLGGDGAFQLRAIGDDGVTTGHQHFRRERLAGVKRLAIDQELLPLLDAVLLSTNLDQ